MSPTKSNYSYYDLDNGRPVEQQPSPSNHQPSLWHYLPQNQAWKTSPENLTDLDYPKDMSGSPEGYQSSSQSSWDSNDILRQRPHSASSASASSPLSVNLTPDPLITFDLYHGEAHLVMKIPPENRFRYRYDTEMSGTHGSLQGIRTGREKCLPSVELVNFPYEALIRVSLVTCNESGDRYPHPHNLFVKEKMYQKKVYVNWDKKTLTKTGHYSDPHYIRVGANKTDYCAKFEGMCIISSKKENFHSSIKEKLQLRDLERRYNAYGEVSLWPGRNEDMVKKVEAVARYADVDFVSLCFEAFREEDGKLIPICKPLYSGPIGNAKSAKTGKLKIARINKCTGSCKGGDEIWLLVEKINKKGLVIKFSEEYDGKTVWQACVEGDDLILHHQYAIIFKTPPYRDTNISSEVEVLMRLERTSQPSQPYDYSEPMTFVYEPLKSRSNRNDNLYKKESILTPLKQLQHKRPRTESSSMTSPYNFPSKRRPDELEFTNLSPLEDPSASDIEQILLENRMDSFEFGQSWSRFNIEEFLQFISSDDAEMPLQKDGVPTPTSLNRRDLLYRFLLMYTQLDEGDVKKLTDQISTFRFSRKDKTENKNGLEKEQVEDAASTLLSLRARVIESTSSGDDSKSEPDTTLHEAVLLNKPDAVHRKLKSGASPCVQDCDGNTALHLSLLHSHDACTDRVLKFSHDTRTFINLKNTEGRAPIHIAAARDNLPSVKLLVDSGADARLTESKTKRNALHIAVVKQNKPLVEYLLCLGADLDAPDANGQTPLQLAHILPSPNREEFVQMFYSKVLKTEADSSGENESKTEKSIYDEKMDNVYQTLNQSGSWRKLAEMWNCGFIISHAEDAKNPTKCIFNCAEQVHGKLELEVVRELLDALNERKAVEVVDEILARNFI